MDEESDIPPEFPSTVHCPKCEQRIVSVKHWSGHIGGESNGYVIQNFCSGTCGKCGGTSLGMRYHDGTDWLIEWVKFDKGQQGGGSDSVAGSPESEAL